MEEEIQNGDCHLSPMQAVLLETFEIFIRFCTENNITYYLAGGTALGAVRHQGFIPWDDDIDVYMKRPDYERLLSLKKKVSEIDCEILTYEDPPYPYPFAKFFSKKQSLWEFKATEVLMAPYIDILPIDETSGDIKTTRARERKYIFNIRAYERCKSIHTWKEVLIDLLSRHFFEGFCKIRRLLLYPSFMAPYYLRKFRQIEKECKTIKGPYYFSYFHCYPIQRELFPKEWFESTIELPFEHLQVTAAIGVNEYLSQLFGNYMQLPPKEKRNSHHHIYYMNLNCRLTIEDIKKELESKNNL